MLRLVLTALFCVLVVTPCLAGDEGVDVGSARTIRVSGRILDAKTGEPLPEAQAMIVGDYGSHRGVAGPDGSFLVTAEAANGLGTLSIVFSHAEHQEKYVETILRDAFRGTVEARTTNGRATIKARDVDLDLACGGTADIRTKSLGSAPFRVICDGGLTGIELEVRGTTIAVLAAQPFTLRVRSGRLEITDSKNETIEMRVTARMLRR